MSLNVWNNAKLIRKYDEIDIKMQIICFASYDLIIMSSRITRNPSSKDEPNIDFLPFKLLLFKK